MSLCKFEKDHSGCCFEKRLRGSRVEADRSFTKEPQ